MLAITPGLQYLLPVMLRTMVGPPAIIYGCYKLVGLAGRDLWIPQSLRSASGLLVATTLTLILRTVLISARVSVRRRRAIGRLGAKPLPNLRGGKWPGNADIVWHLTKYFENEYLGEGFEITSHDNSDLFTFNVLWTETVRPI